MILAREIQVTLTELAADNNNRLSHPTSDRIPKMMMARLLLLVGLSCSSALHLSAITRRQALGLGAAAVVVPTPALAKSKRSMNPNKEEGMALDKEWQRQFYKDEYAAMAGDKGSRGVASKEFEKNDTVQLNRVKNLGVARDENGKKITTADRNRDPAELGLKQWGGETAGTSRYGSSSAGEFKSSF